MMIFFEDALKLTAQEMIEYVKENGMNQLDIEYIIYDNSFDDCDYFPLTTTTGKNLVEQLTYYYEVDKQDPTGDVSYYALACMTKDEKESK